MDLPNEYQECVTFSDWLLMSGYKYTHIPNETYTTFMGTKMKNKRMGVKKGIPDYMIVVPNKGLVFIEMKRQKGGKVSPEQKEWIEELNKIDNIEATVCYGAEQAIEFISSL